MTTLKRFLAIAIWLSALLSAAAAADCPAIPQPGLPRLETVEVHHLTEVCHKAYVSVVDTDAKVPRFVAYELTAEHVLGCDVRSNDFHEDAAALSADQAGSRDYMRSGYDKGHQAPAEDFAWGQQEEQDSFSFANIAPQRSGLNRQQWERLEATVRSWAMLRGPLAVYTGPVLSGDRTIGPHKVAVPTAFWKVIVDRGDKGNNVIAFEMPNKAIKKGPLQPYQVPLSKVEADAQLKFPESLKDGAALWKADLKSLAKQKKVHCHKKSRG